ncbi:IniB N-terminal domain-containing protein [Actinosynnema sp. CS-041913]|uniref:IniB N-terminal domain-containing protein n=1 Tax=Actinosynnema sp. CS-041913 TaxID=3239917 RepID=UPI003D929812
MGTSPNTLHDFVLDLLSNPAALADFQADAEGTLAAAGLSDISALDVQEVLPLVLDYVPAGSLPALDGALINDLPLDATDALGAIGQLQAVAQQLSLSGVSGTSDVNLAAAGALSADANGLEVFGGFSGWGLTDAVGSVDGSVSGDFSAVGDVTDTLDATLATATGPVDDLAGTATGSLDGASAGGVTGALPGTDGLTSPVFGAVDTLTGVVDGVTGGLAGNLVGDLPGNVTGTLDPSHLGKTLNVDGLTALPERDLTPETVVDTIEDTTGRLSNGTGVSNVTDHVGAIDLPLLGLGLNDLPVVGGEDISDTLF